MAHKNAAATAAAAAKLCSQVKIKASLTSATQKKKKNEPEMRNMQGRQDKCSRLADTA